jgi:flagellar biosynthesis/type III secretory pathway M-ring protein FliF/YscJ
MPMSKQNQASPGSAPATPLHLLKSRQEFKSKHDAYLEYIRRLIQEQPNRVTQAVKHWINVDA